MEQQKNRVVCFDYLRVFATLAVIILHVASQNWYRVEVSLPQWSALNIYDSLVRWSVPSFAMISGALFLSRPIETRKIYRKYILRLVAAYFAWSVFYAVFFPALHQLFTKGYSFPVKSVIGASLRGHFHMWFIPMIAGLYMSIPLLQPIVRSPKTTRYFLILAFIFTFALPQISDLTRHFGGGFLASLVDCINRIIGSMHFHIALGYAGYFVLGYYLSRHEMKASHRYIVYLLGIAGTIATICLTAAASRKTGSPTEVYYDYLTVNVLMQAVAVFTLFKSVMKSAKLLRWITVLSKCSFGVYLVHIFVLDILSLLGLHSLSFHPALSVPVISFVVAAVSFAISYLINRIPVLNKYIV